MRTIQIATIAAALLAGVLLTPQRRILFTPWILAGGTIAFLIFLPNLIWNIQNGWPFLELMRNVRATGKDVVLPPGQYLLQQILMLNPVSFPFWFGGLLFLLFSRDARIYRALGWTLRSHARAARSLADIRAERRDEDGHHARPRRRMG